MPDSISQASTAQADTGFGSAGSEAASIAHDKLVLLNWLVSRSITRAPQGINPPTMGALELFQIIDSLRRTGAGHVHLGRDVDDEGDDGDRLLDASVIRVKDIKFEKTEECSYITVLVEFIDENVKSFAVGDKVTFVGREIQGNRTERGVVTAHFGIRVGADTITDHGQYRCVFEHNAPISRRYVSFLLSKLLRRYARQNEFEFSVTVTGRNGKAQEKPYRFRPRIEFLADVGRRLNASVTQNRELSKIVFVKRSSRETIGEPSEIKHEEIIADLDIRISGKQAPTDPNERAGWLSRLKKHYHDLGYESQIYYRHLRGGGMGGAVESAVDGAGDLLLCPRETISLPGPLRRWHSQVDDATHASFKALLDTDELWERTVR